MNVLLGIYIPIKGSIIIKLFVIDHHPYFSSFFFYIVSYHESGIDVRILTIPDILILYPEVL